MALTIRKIASQTTILERFPAKWIPVRVRKTSQIENESLRSDSIGTEKALDDKQEVRA